MKKNIIKYTLITTGIFILIIIYLSLIGLDTERFNNQIKDKVIQKNKNVDLKLKKIRLTLDPLNFKIKAKTIDAKIVYKNKIIELDHIKTQVSLISFFKDKLISSNLKVLTKSILLKDLVSLVRAIDNRPEVFFLERLIKKGYVVVNIEMDFDESGNIKNDYKITGSIKDGKINLSKNYNFEKINFLLDIKNDILDIKNLNFTTNKINFFSENLKITKKENNLLFEGSILNKQSTFNDKLHNLIKLNFKNINIESIIFSSKNIFSFKVENDFKIKNLVIESEIQIDNCRYKKPVSLTKYFPTVKELIYLKDHKIKAKYKKNELSLSGLGNIKLQKEYDKIKYSISKKGKDFKFFSNIELSELNIKNKIFLKNFFPEINEIINIKNHKVSINYDKNNLLIKGFGKIKLQDDFEKIDYSFLKIKDKINFDTKLELEKTSLNIDYLDYKKIKKLKTHLVLIGNYKKDIELNLNSLRIIDKKNRIILKNILLDKNNKIKKFDKIDLNYLDSEKKNNQLILKRIHKNNYELIGSALNANSLITNLLKSESSEHSKIFKNDINLSLNLKEVHIDNKNILKKLNGNIKIKENKIFQTNISALFDDNKNFTFTVNTNSNGEKITTLFSSRAKPLVKRYKFIKGFEGGYIDFYSSKKNKISNSKLNIYDFKLEELPTLTKILTLASLQGIADILSGEGIRFDELEMNFINQDNTMTIDEIYAIGPAISILMSGYVERDKLVSLRGTLVPATTINKTISSIPILGKILVGNKIGEGVFGVSFKIKGSPKDLVTTVNPIKTLTPRFITRTLEKIKKN